MPEGVIKLTEKQLLEVGKPVDFSFKHLTSLEGVAIEGPRSQRIGQIPIRGATSRRYLTRAVWLNNNKLPNIRHMDALINSALEDPSKLGWIDFSFNYITEIDECILKFPNLSIVYFHGNLIKNVDEVFRLRPLRQLRTVTFHGNPISETRDYRHYVITYLPQVQNLDFSPITILERREPKPPTAVKKVSATANS
ncbi:hypothetical protein PPYR_02988 [Photinus pyralis]|uniref:Leucine-rich repeat-containing protein 51 n=2 Tax=Photinus pyralis TaxID=7054 RepID=A0A1Y1L743_PHOPY|nr:leucine-rich repeat-containing protein 51-like isoform X2 [Photinus pyralis]XP_031330405.1 leucine-rich repeat-containing protein 51-like isoform X2 [Photinus pyralis]XP_031331742.1 leucine-rich repeat-containing protein 51-like [Photinus pyralis]KAB0791140.1 hypothetical protein PPYR_02940 [Photinus pyralis]KAB0791188.1 hypothetical protein PPYR_02988 [Photinus pyralis]